jgi:hypothetical protein
MVGLSIDKEGCHFFKGDRREDGICSVVCELNQGQCSPCNWNI